MVNFNSARKTQRRRYLKHYFQHHQYAWQHGLRQLTKNSIASILTIAAISITLVLPTALFILLNNMQNVSKNWNTSTAISVYLTPSASNQQIQYVKKVLQSINNIKKQQYISPQQGLVQFAKQSGLNNIIKTLGENPLPGVFIIQPNDTNPAKLNILVSQLRALPQVDNVKFDMQWVKRFNAIINLLRHFTYGIAIVLALAVLLIIGNTIRMSIQSYHCEIEVAQLIGGSNRFIRRPFLYSGLFYGIASAIFAAIILNFLIIFLQSSVNKLATLYNTQFTLHGLTLKQTSLLILIGALLGFLGSWFAVNKHLRKIQA